MCTLPLTCTLAMTWLNTKWSDFYLISLPFSVVAFAFMATNLAYDAETPSFTKKVESLDDDHNALSLYRMVGSQPRISIACGAVLCILNQVIQLRRESFGNLDNLFFELKNRKR